MTARILVAGSDSWADRSIIVDVFVHHLTRTVEMERAALVHGDGSSGDRILGEVWEALRRRSWPLTAVEVWPASRFGSSRDRNEHLVKLGADLSLIFADDWDSNAGQVGRLARWAGIRTEDIGVRTDPEARRAA